MFDWLTTIIGAAGPLGVFGLMFLENVFPPIPSEVVMPLAGFETTRGSMTVLAAWIAGTAGSVAGAVLWFLVGARLGEDRMRRFVRRHGIWLTLDEADYDRALDWFRRRGVWAVGFGRLVPGVRTLISVPAGLAGLAWGPFLAATTIGSGLWVGVLLWAGRALGAAYDRVADWLDPITTAVLVGIVAWYLVRLGRGLMRR